MTTATVQLPQIHGQDQLTHSRMSCFRTCNRKHYFSYELGIRPDRDATALRIGGCVHRSLESLWANADLDAALAVIASNYETLPGWVNSDAAARDWAIESNTVAALIVGYWNRWASSTPIALAAEQQFNVPIRNPETGAASRTFTVAGKIDAIAMIDGQLCVVEHKTTGDDIGPDSDYWKRLRIDQQISLYMLAAQQLGHDVITVHYDVIRKPSIRPYSATPKETRKYKADGTLYANQRAEDETPDEWFARLTADIASRPDFYYQRREIPRLESDLDDFRAELWQMSEMLREAKNKERWPRNTGACVGFGRCEYLDVCHNGIDLAEIPQGMHRVSTVHQELKGEVE